MNLLNETTLPVSSYLTSENKEILFAIGPEGGFSKKEEEIINESYSKLKDILYDFCNLDNNGLMNKYNNK